MESQFNSVTVFGFPHLSFGATLYVDKKQGKSKESNIKSNKIHSLADAMPKSPFNSHTNYYNNKISHTPKGVLVFP